MDEENEWILAKKVIRGAGFVLVGLAILTMVVAVEPVLVLLTGKTYRQRHPIEGLDGIDHGDPGVDVDECS